MSDPSETHSPIGAAAIGGGTQSFARHLTRSARTRTSGARQPAPVPPRATSDIPRASDRLRRIADILELAGKAISMVACARGIEYSSDIHRVAQSDLRALAELLVEYPQLDSDFAAGIGIQF